MKVTLSICSALIAIGAIVGCLDRENNQVVVDQPHRTGWGPIVVKLGGSGYLLPVRAPDEATRKVAAGNEYWMETIRGKDITISVYMGSAPIRHKEVVGKGGAVKYENYKFIGEVHEIDGKFFGRFVTKQNSGILDLNAEKDSEPDVQILLNTDSKPNVDLFWRGIGEVSKNAGTDL